MKNQLLSLGVIVMFSGTALAKEIASEASLVTPLLIGSPVPSAEVKNPNGTAVSLDNILKNKKAIVIFYRGGWCPYCNLQLSGLQKIVPDLKNLGVQIIALSADRPEEINKSLVKHHLDYELYSDSEAHASRAFGIAFQVDTATNLKMRLVGINLDAASGNDKKILPVPSVFIVGPDSKIKFTYVNPDYKERIDADMLKQVAIGLFKK